MRVVAEIYCGRGEHHLACLCIKSIEGIKYSCYPTIIKVDMECSEEKRDEVINAIKRGFYPYKIILS